MPKFNLELFKTLILNLANSKRRKLGMFIFFQKYIFDPGLEPLEKYSFYPRTITEWNKLPRKIELSNSLAAFKNAISNIY